MADDIDLDNDGFGEFDDEDSLQPSEFDDAMGGEIQSGSRSVISDSGRSFLEGMIGSATDNREIASKVKKALPTHLQENWEETEDLLDYASRSKDAIVNPIRKEMVNFKRNINKVTPLVKRYLGEGIGNKFDELTKTPEQQAEIDPNTQELTQTIAGIFNEESRAAIEKEERQLVIDMMDRQTEEDRWKLSMTTMNDMLNSIRRMDQYNQRINYTFQQKSLEYDIKRFHLLTQILDVNKTVGEASVGFLRSIVHNTSLPELVKQRNSELFQQMFVEKWYGDTLDSVSSTGRSMMRRFGQNILNRAKQMGTNIVDGMRTVGDLADTVGGMADMGLGDDEVQYDAKRETAKLLAGQLGGGIVNKGISEIIATVHDSMKGSERYKDFMAQSANVASNRNLFFKTFIEDMANKDEGFLKLLAPVFNVLKEELPNDRIQMASIGHLNSFKPTDPRQWDQASRDALIEIIPGWLERIHNLIAEQMGKSERLAFDKRQGDFIDKNTIKQQILDSIMTDTERTETTKVLDNMINLLGKNIDGIGDEERTLLREWLIREGSETANLDVRNLQRAGSFEGLNNYDDQVAERIAGAFSQVFDPKTVGRLNKDALSQRDTNLHLTEAAKEYKKVVAAYSNDQEVFNTAITGGNRRLLRELGFLTEDGNIDQKAILHHKLQGYDSTRDVNHSLANLGEQLDQANPKPTPPPVPNYRPGQPPAPYGAPIYGSPLSGTPPNYFGGQGLIDNMMGSQSINGVLEAINNFAPTRDNPVPVELITGTVDSSESLKREITRAVSALTDIRDDVVDITEMLRDKVNGTPTRSLFNMTINPRGVNDGMVDDDVQVRDYLSAILRTMATMHAANIEYYQNVKEFELGRHGLSEKVKKIIGDTMDKVIGVGSWFGKKIGSMADFAGASFNAIKEGFGQRFSWDAADVYVGDEESPRILARHFRTKEMYIWHNGVAEDKPIRSPEEIVAEVRDHEGNVIIHQEEVDYGLVRVMRNGALKRVGNLLGSLTGGAIDGVNGVFNLTRRAGSIVQRIAGGVLDGIDKALDGLKDVYIVAEDGKRKLLASVKEIREGKILVEVEGEFEVVKGMADLFKGNLYRRNSETGEPEVIATIGDMKQGLYDVSGKLIEHSKGFFGKLADGIRGGAEGLWTLSKLPFTILGHTWKAIQSKLESKMLEKLIINIPKDILITANVVYLNDTKRGANRRGGKGPSPKANRGRPKQNEDETVSPQQAINDASVKDDNIRTVIDNYASKMNAKWDELMANGRGDRAKAHMEKMGKDKEVLQKMFKEAWENRKDEDGNLSLEHFKEKFLKERFGEDWEKKKSSIKDAIREKGWDKKFDAVKDTISNGKTATSISKGVKTVGDLVSQSSLAKGLMQRAKPLSGAEINDNYDKLVRYGKRKDADEYIGRLRHQPTALQSVIDNAWEKHVTNSSHPMAKETFTELWVRDKFGMESDKIMQTLAEGSDIRAIGRTAFGKLKNKLFGPKVDKDGNPVEAGPSLGERLSTLGERTKEMLGSFTNGSNETNSILGSIKDMVHSRFLEESEEERLLRKEREEEKAEAKRKAKEEKEEKAREKREAKEAERIARRDKRLDPDGDGVKEGGWQDMLRKASKKRSDKRKKEREERKARGEKSVGSKILGNVGAILGGVGSMIGGLTSGIFGLTKAIGQASWFITKFAAKGIFLLGKELALGMWKVLGPLLNGVLTLGAKAVTGVASGIGAAWTATKAAVAPHAAKAGAFVARKGAQYAATAGLVAAGFAAPVGMVLGVALTAWTVWEASVAIFSWWKRRNEIEIMEYLRHLQYGMVSGDKGAHHLNKISLRYFEDEILKEKEIRGDSIVIKLTTHEVWEKYRGDFEDSGDAENEHEFKRWYEYRFLPVLYKWMGMCGKWNQPYKNMLGSGPYAQNSNLTLSNLDDVLQPELKAGFTRQVMQFDELDFDPLMIMSSPSTAVLCTTDRRNCQEYADKIIEYLKVKLMGDAHPDNIDDGSNMPDFEYVDNGDGTFERVDNREKKAEMAEKARIARAEHAAKLEEEKAKEEAIAEGGEEIIPTEGEPEISPIVVPSRADAAPEDVLLDKDGNEVVLTPETSRTSLPFIPREAAIIARMRRNQEGALEWAQHRQKVQVADKYGISVELIDKIINSKHGSKGDAEMVTSAGRFGLMQIPRDAQKGPYRQRNVNLAIGASLLKELQVQYGSDYDAIEAAYFSQSRPTSTSKPVTNTSNDATVTNVINTKGVNSDSTKSTARNPKSAISNTIITKADDGGYDVTNVNPFKKAAEMDYLSFIKSKEGFSEKAFWDHQQWSIGYGTKTTDPDEINGTKVISEEEATRRLKEYTDRSRPQIIKAGEAQGLTWTERELDALTSFTYNLGLGNLKRLIRNRDKEQIANAMPLYSKASGKTLPGLLARRQEEVEMFREGAMSPGGFSQEIETLNKTNETMDAKPPLRTLESVQAKTSQAPVETTAKVIEDVAPVSQEISVSLKDLPDNTGIEEGINNGNTLAGKSLGEQEKTNQLLSGLVNHLETILPNSTAVASSTTTPLKTEQPTPDVKVVSAAPLRIDTQSQYK